MVAMTHDSHDDHGSHAYVWYFGVFLALLVCTGLSVLFDVITLPYSAKVICVLSVACAKALFVMVYFMHLKFEGKWKYVLLAPTTVLAIGLPLALLPDIGIHYYEDLSPQKAYAQEYRETPTPTHGHGADAKDHSPSEGSGE